MKAWLAFLPFFLALALAQVVTPFQARYGPVNERGDVIMLGNTLMCMSLPSSVACDNSWMNDSTKNNTALVNNNQLDPTRNMVFANYDSSAPTWGSGRGGSTSATLSLPSGAQVLWAGLYWGARANPNASGRTTIYVKPPGAASYQAVTGQLLGTITNQGTNTARPYAAFADLTSLVQARGSGVYWVGGILAEPGNDGLGYYAGWSLVVVYRDPSATFKNIVVYDGLASVSQGNNVTLTPSGFLTPATGAVNARVGAVAFEGDAGIVGDQLLLNNSALSDAQNPSNNFFNSSISRLGTRFTTKNPDWLNQMAVDIDLLDATGRIPNGATSATLTFTSSGDTYFPSVLVFATDIYFPDLKTTFTKTVTDLNGGQVQPGDILEYEVSFRNTGLDGAARVVLSDPIPSGTQYVPGSLQVVQNATGAPTGTFTDTPGDDIAEYQAAGNQVVFRLGTGANASQGGLILPGQEARVRFRVQVLPSAAGQNVVNTATITYQSQTLGTSFTDSASTGISVTVAGYTLSGTVYFDLNQNQQMDTGEAWFGPSVWVKLVRNGSVIATAQVDAGTGSYQFANLAPGSYTIFVDTNANPGDLTPTSPMGLAFLDPPTGSRSLSLSSDTTGLDFGLGYAVSPYAGQVVINEVLLPGSGRGMWTNSLRFTTPVPAP